MFNRRIDNVLITCICLSIVLHCLGFLAYLGTRWNLVHQTNDTVAYRPEPPGDIGAPGIRTKLAPFQGGAIPTDSDCYTTYQGVGVQFAPLTGVVEIVSPDGPAYKAGVHVSDILTIIGETSNSTRLRLRRGTRVWILTLNKAPICVRRPRG